MKLMTKEIEKRLEKFPLYAQDGKSEEEKTVVCKFFAPWGNWTWYVLEGSKIEDGYGEKGDWEFFGLTVGDFTEYGYFTLSDLESIGGPWGLKIERDMYFTPCKLSEVLKDEVGVW